MLNQPLEHINRHSCLRFMEIQDQAGLSSLTINRRLAAVSRSIAQSYAQYLAAQVAAGHYSKNYHADLYSSIHRFFDFVIDERLETSPARNPFSPRDLPRRPDMIPRYIPDQELRKVLASCSQEATLFERTLVLTLLHTGIRSLEFTRLKASDIVQIGGVWKLHIHEGKGLRDRLIPLTAQCLAALQDCRSMDGNGYMTLFLLAMVGPCKPMEEFKQRFNRSAASWIFQRSQRIASAIPLPWL